VCFRMYTTVFARRVGWFPGVMDGVLGVLAILNVDDDGFVAFRVWLMFD
jgi:hypothetical protein